METAKDLWSQLNRDTQGASELSSIQPINAVRIESVEQLKDLPTAPNIFEDPHWLGNDEENIEKFRRFWKNQGRSEYILDKLLHNTHFISKERYQGSVVGLVQSIDTSCTKPVVLSVPTTLGGKSPLEMIRIIKGLGLLASTDNVLPWWQITEYWERDEIEHFFSSTNKGTFVGIDDVGFGGTTMEMSTPPDHLNYRWTIEYAVVAASRQAVTHYLNKGRVTNVHLCYRILSLEEIFNTVELDELASYYGGSASDIAWRMTTFRHNTVADYFFPGLVKDRNYAKTVDDKEKAGIVELYRLRDSRKEEFGLK